MGRWNAYIVGTFSEDEFVTNTDNTLRTNTVLKGSPERVLGGWWWELRVEQPESREHKNGSAKISQKPIEQDRGKRHGHSGPYIRLVPSVGEWREEGVHSAAGPGQDGMVTGKDRVLGQGGGECRRDASSSRVTQCMQRLSCAIFCTVHVAMCRVSPQGGGGVAD